MDQELHLTSTIFVDIGKLVTSDELANSEVCFLFEPMANVPFSRAWSWQKQWQDRLLSRRDSSQAVWLLEHSTCYTLGRGASESNLLFDPSDSSYSLYRIDRGGEVTHHLPGQLVVYPILDLRRYKTDLNWYLRELEQVIIDVLDGLGLKGKRLPGITGVWIDDFKVASIGIGCRRWITQHGFSLNIDCGLSGFDCVIPCGLTDHKVGRLNKWIPDLTVKDVKPLVKKALSNHFDLSFDSNYSLEM